MLKRAFTVLLGLCLLSAPALAQLPGGGFANTQDYPAEFSAEPATQQVEVGQTLLLRYQVEIEDGWYIYSNDFDPECGPSLAAFSLKQHPSFKVLGPTKALNAKAKYDSIFGCEVKIHKHTARFQQKIRVLKKDLQLMGSYEFSACNLESGMCKPPHSEEFSITEIKVLASKHPETTPEKANQADSAATEAAAKGGGPADTAAVAQAPDSAGMAAASDTAASSGQAGTPQAQQNPTEAAKASTSASGGSNQSGFSWWLFVVAALGQGFAAVATPCVWPMLPMTVTFFLKNSENDRSGLLNSGRGQALIYALSVIGIYTLIGVALSVLLGQAFGNLLATHWAPNLIFFGLFLFFALSFLGMFEIVLPSSWINNLDANSERGGLIGIFFMAFTLVLVSFSCTGMFVGNLISEAADGTFLKPLVGFGAYSAAFASPFAVFALFPSMMKNMPKSGGWLNAVKVVLGFGELALALKFLSIPDQTYHWGILPRPIYLSLWIVIFALMGFYLLGKIRLPHDSPLEKISVPRLLLATATFAFVVYLIPGLFGAPLEPLSGILPPKKQSEYQWTQASVSGGGGSSPNAQAMGSPTLCGQPKYGDMFELPHNLKGYFDYQQALECAQELNKPVFLDFTGHGCVNCRQVEQSVWNKPKVLNKLREDFVIASLYVDDKTTLPKDQWYTSEADGEQKTTIGDQMADLQWRKFHVSAQPYYVIVTPEGKPLVEPIAFETDAADYAAWLEKGLQAFSQNPS